ncbi:MAG: peptidase domain-containing ABC transporter [Betaproteobacteria bacterium]|nr:peptidase domain-containing ABC transporter [Betaproteobacteria bacterium]
MRDAAPDPRTIALTQDDLLWAAGSLCNLHRLPFSAALLQRECPPPCSATQLIAALADLGLRARVVEVARSRVPAELLPAIAFLHPSADAMRAADPAPPEGASPRVPAARLALVVRIESARVLLFHAGSNEPTVMSAADFDAVASGRLLAVEADAAPGDDDDALPRRRGFGFRWFADELLRHRRAVRDVLAASLAVQLIALATPLCSQIIIDKVIAHQVESTLAVIAVALASLIVFSSLLGWIRQFLVAHVGNAVDAALGSAVFRHLIRLPLPFFERRPTGVLAARLQGIETIREFLSGATVTLLLDVPFIGLFLGFMLVYSVPLSAVTLALMVLIVVLSALAAPLFQVRLDEQFLRGARNQAFVTEHVAGIETVKSLQMESALERRYDAQLRTYLDASFATRCLANTYHTLAGALEQLQGAAVLCLGAMLVMRGPDFTIGMLVAFQMFAARVTQPMLRLVGLWQQFQMATIAVRRLADIMDVPPEPRTLVAAVEATGPARVEFRGVGFRYAAARPRVLQGFDLDVAAGECVAIIGASGAGKSTLAKLLQGFVHPTEGEVRLDGRDTRSLAANELRTALGVVPQETVLFSGNVHDNLVVAHPHASHEGVVQACRLAEIHAVLQALPDGYQTLLGERGTGLSGGQRQRLAIARALLKRPRVLIFDEATSSLDPAVAEQIAATIARFRRQVTILFITHRVPAALAPDRVIELPRPAGA